MGNASAAFCFIAAAMLFTVTLRAQLRTESNPHRINVQPVARRPNPWAGQRHNLRNAGKRDCKLIAIYTFRANSGALAGIHASGLKAQQHRMQYVWEQQLA
jgi:hypothetical protein